MTCRTALSAALLALVLTACGGGGDAPAGATGPDAPAESTGEATTGPTGEAPTDEAAVEPGATLLASVGTDDDPEAFVIALTDSDGNPVRELPAGTYTFEVSDPSQTHNFALSDPSGSEVFATGVRETGDESFEVELTAGEYGYVCDPHPSMSGSFTVT